SRADRGRLGDVDGAGVLLVPAEPGDVVVAAVQDAELRGRGGGWQPHPVAVQPPAAPPDQLAQKRRIAAAEGPLQDVVAEPIDLDSDEAALVGRVVAA